MKRFKFFVVAAVVACGLIQGGPVAAQASLATYSKEAMDNLVGLLKKAATDGYTMEPNGTSIFGGWLPKGSKQGNEVWIPVLKLLNVDPNKSHRVIAAGDLDTKDLDLRIVDSDGKVVAVDDTVLRDAEVTFRPTRRQDYTIQVRIYDSTDKCICIGAILSKAEPARIVNMPILIPAPTQDDPVVIQGSLQNTDAIDLVRKRPAKVHFIELKAGNRYVIDLTSNTFDTYLRLENGNRTQLASDDDSGIGLNSRIIFDCQADGLYRIIATSYGGGQGGYTLQVANQP